MEKFFEKNEDVAFRARKALDALRTLKACVDEDAIALEAVHNCIREITLVERAYNWRAKAEYMEWRVIDDLDIEKRFKVKDPENERGEYW